MQGVENAETEENPTTEITSESTTVSNILISEENHALIEEVHAPSSSSSSDTGEPYSSDDSVQDPNYLSGSSSSSSWSENASSSENNSGDTVEPETKKRTRKRKPIPFHRKKTCAKRLRNSGKAYNDHRIICTKSEVVLLRSSFPCCKWFYRWWWR
jgi:hypothetical protein